MIISSERGDHQPDFGKEQRDEDYNKRRKEEIEKLREEDAKIEKEKAKQERIDKTARELLERLNLNNGILNKDKDIKPTQPNMFE